MILRVLFVYSDHYYSTGEQRYDGNVNKTVDGKQ